MSRTLTEALLLRRTDLGESDCVVQLLGSTSGRVTAIAKGAKRSRRRFPGTLDLFNHLQVQLERPRSHVMARLEHARLLASFPRLRTDPSRFALGCYLLELLGRLAPEGGAAMDSRRLFAVALGALRAVESRTPDQRLRTLLELRALDTLGLKPELRRCVRCGDELRGDARIGFHVADGGPLCGACATRVEGLLPVHLGTLRALERGLQLEIDQLDRLALSPTALVEARQLVSRFQRFHVGVELRSERFLDETLRAARPGPG